MAPTTELVELVGVPFMRVGSQRQEVRGGIVSQLSRTMELSTNYRFQWVDFDEDAQSITVLQGGHSHGGALGIKRAMTDRLWLTGDYDLTLARQLDGNDFTVQNSFGGVEYLLTEHTRIFGSAGVSHLAGNDAADARVGPAVRVGVARDLQSARVNVVYSRSYVPSWGFGGTSDNEELTTALHVPIGRRFSAQTAVSFRRNEPLEQFGLPLRSLWFHGSLGYLLTDWVRVEAFTAGTRQDIDRPDGRVNRYTFGLQLTAATTARIR
jgi:hypothetical protein